MTCRQILFLELPTAKCVGGRQVSFLCPLLPREGGALEPRSQPPSSLHIVTSRGSEE